MGLFLDFDCINGFDLSLSESYIFLSLLLVDNVVSLSCNVVRSFFLFPILPSGLPHLFFTVNFFLFLFYVFSFFFHDANDFFPPFLGGVLGIGAMYCCASSISYIFCCFSDLIYLCGIQFRNIIIVTSVAIA